LGWETAILHFAYGLLSALVLGEASLLGYRRLPFASSYVPTVNVTAYGGIYACIFLAGVYAVAWLERLALSTTRGTVVLFVVTGTILAVIRGMDVWQRRDRVEVELDELVDPPTLRLGLTE
jgi:inner membrane protein involved in colicin E2 resistance